MKPLIYKLGGEWRVQYRDAYWRDYERAVCWCAEMNA